MRVTLCLLALFAAGSLVACGFDVGGEDRPPPAEGGEGKVGSYGESSACNFGSAPKPPQADLGAIDLQGDGLRLRMQSAPIDPSYSAVYPIEGLVTMRVRIDAGAHLVATCMAPSGPVSCNDHPFYARARSGNVEVVDAYGKLVFRAEIPRPPPTVCLPPTAPAGCTVVASARATFCADVNRQLEHTKFKIECGTLDEPIPPLLGAPPPTTAPRTACMPFVEEATKKAITSLSACAPKEDEDVPGETMVSSWSSAARAQMFKAGICQGSPLVLDLDGSGFAFSVPEDGVSFDLQNDGVKEKTAWPAKKSIAFLALDRNGDGSITADELFGTATSNGRYADGFEALRELDANGDLLIDRRDPVFASLLLWRDLDRDGMSTRSELGLLGDHGIEQLDLGATRIERPSAWDSHGNEIPLVSRYRSKDGRTGALVDVFLRFKP